MKFRLSNLLALLLTGTILLSTAALAVTPQEGTTTQTPASGEAAPQEETPSANQESTVPSEGQSAQDADTPPATEATPDSTTATEDPPTEPDPTEEPPAEPPASDGFALFTDAVDHWAAPSLRSAWEEGILQGFEDNTMRPNGAFTGAQMATVLTRLLHAEQRGNVTGLEDNVWYRDAAAKAVSLGILETSQVSTMNQPLNRLQACAMLSDAFQLEQGDPNTTKAAAYADFNELSKFHKGMIATLVDQGVIQGWEGNLHLDAGITRAEFFTILYRVLPQHLTLETGKTLGPLTEDTLLSVQDLTLEDTTLSAGLWLDCINRTVSLKKVTAPSLTLRGDALTSLTLEDSHLTRLVLATRSGDVKLTTDDDNAIDTIVVGDGGGKVSLNTNRNHVEITGAGRAVTITGSVGTLAISGNYNTITLAPQTTITNLKITGRNNTLTVGSAVTQLLLDGRENTLTGQGAIQSLTWNSATSNCELTYETLTDNRDYGVKGLSATIAAPVTLPVETPLEATASFQTTVTGKKLSVTWTVDSKPVKTETITLSPSATSTLSHSYTYTKDLAATSQIGFVATYLTYDEDTQTISAPVVTVNLENHSAEYYAARDADTILAKVTTYYKGNRTTQWAVDNDLADYEKEVFVNAKGYASSTPYLIWVNIGTQHTTIFQGSQGNWQLVRSGLVSTGANEATPRGVFKTMHKQRGWFTKTYDVRPVVHFRSGGFAFHSRLYYPGTNRLWTNSNGVGYPLSHGCVRMEQEDIQWLYDNIPTGTTVVVH